MFVEILSSVPLEKVPFDILFKTKTYFLKSVLDKEVKEVEISIS